MYRKFWDFLHFDTSKLDGVSFQASIMHEESPLFCRVTSGFHQIVMEAGSQDLTTFSCPVGKFKFVRMPFGLKNAPAIFQAVVEEVLRPMNNVCSNYVDDVLVYSKSWEVHLKDIESGDWFT